MPMKASFFTFRGLFNNRTTAFTRGVTLRMRAKRTPLRSTSAHEHLSGHARRLLLAAVPEPAPVDLLADCPACRLESGRMERYDALAAAYRFGIAARTECKLCEARWEAALEPALDRGHDLRLVPSNECPRCRALLPPEALDAHGCAACGAKATLR